MCIRYLELQMNSIEGDMAGVASTQTEEMDRLKEEETSMSTQQGDRQVEKKRKMSTVLYSIGFRFRSWIE